MENDLTSPIKQRPRRAWSPISVYCSPYTMKRCKHEALVELSASLDPCLVDSHRLGRLVDTLARPDQQAPLLIIRCFRTNEKQAALSQLFLANETQGRDRRPAMCKMYADALTTHDKNPIFFVDIDPNYGPPLQDTTAHCHHFQAHHIRQRPHKVQINTLLMNSLLLPFTDVMCIFADDIGGLDGVTQHLQAWADSGVITAPRRHTVRIVIILLEGNPNMQEPDSTEFWRTVQSTAVKHTFPHISFEVVSSEERYDARYISLRSPLLHMELTTAKEERRERKHLFSGPHLASLFSQCLAHTATSLSGPFDFIEGTCLGILSPPFFRECAAAYLRATHDHGISYQTVASLLASSLLMQACPPSAHSELSREAFLLQTNTSA